MSIPGLKTAIVGLLRSLYGFTPGGGGSGGTSSVQGPFVVNSTVANAVNFEVKDTAGVSRFSFSLNTYELLIGSVSIQGSSGNVTLLANSDIRANSFAAFTVTNPTIRWPSNSPDVSLFRLAAGVVTAGSGGPSGVGWIQNGAGISRVAVDGTNNTATPATTNLSVTLAAGRTYSFTMVLFVNQSVAVDGSRIDFDGGTATATDFEAWADISDTIGVRPMGATAALATDLTDAATTGDGRIVVHGTITVDAAGTFIPRYAMEAVSTGVLTLKRGSYLMVEDMTA